MNYIKQLTHLFEKSAKDSGFTPTHLSIFIALFQRWNQARFKTSIQINRDDIMSLAKVQSKATYHRSMRYLHQHHYIDYQPSYNPHLGSCIRFFPAPSQPPIKPVQHASTRPINEPYNKQVIYQSIKHIEIKKPKQNLASNPGIYQNNPFKKEKSSAKKEKPTPPQHFEVQQYFLQQGSTTTEAERFINHYTANGWLVGGKSPMINWKASVKNWISNSLNFNNYGKATQQHRAQQLNTRTDKSYHEPL